MAWYAKSVLIKDRRYETKDILISGKIYFDKLVTINNQYINHGKGRKKSPVFRQLISRVHDTLRTNFYDGLDGIINLPAIKSISKTSNLYAVVDGYYHNRPDHDNVEKPLNDAVFSFFNTNRLQAGVFNDKLIIAGLPIINKISKKEEPTQYYLYDLILLGQEIKDV